MARYIYIKRIANIKEKHLPPIGTIVDIRLLGDLKHNSYPYEILRLEFPISKYELETYFKEVPLSHEISSH